MKLMKHTSTYLVILLIVFACCTQETEALRRVLRGRRTLTRSYFEGLAIPGWALVTVIALAELLLGAILYVVMYKFIIAKDSESTTNTYAPASTGYAPAATTPYTPVTGTSYTPHTAATPYAPAATAYTPPPATVSTSDEKKQS
ncbi:hypothetical protein DOY81_002258 [Sarcophaga bullata]|nr:hypothetical protein DOY81_002258 [Sarcophaga bullata]